jgi:hypothetical protein
MRGVFIGFLLWMFALFLFFFVLGGMGLFGRSYVETAVKRGVAQRMTDPSDPFADNDLDPYEAQREAERTNGEFQRWAQQERYRNPVSPTTPRGTAPRPMTDLRRY